jgi:hypothetical protein
MNLMRAALLVFFACLVFGLQSYAQSDPCNARIPSSKPDGQPLTSSELAHEVIMSASPDERHKFYWGDVEFVLRCGNEKDASELFAAVRNESVRMNGATVFEASSNFIRVSWDDGFNLGGFRFNFETPLSAPLKPGQKIFISGAYSSFTRDPFQINFANSSFLPMPIKKYRD